MDLPPELMEQVLSHLSNADLGNLAMTCRQMRDWLDPRLASRLKRLVWANPNIVRLIRPEQPEDYGITQEDKLTSDNLQEAEALAVRDKLRGFAEDLYACPMLAKYVKHVFIDYRKLSPENDGFYGCEYLDCVRQFINNFVPKLPTAYEYEYDPEFWMSECGWAATVLVKLNSAESLVLVGCNTHGFQDHVDPITAALSLSSTPGYQQKRLRSLKYLYAWGCSIRSGPGYAPWKFGVLPSVKTLECQEVCGPLPDALGPYKHENDYILRSAPECDRYFHLETLMIRQRYFEQQSFFKIFKYTPYLKRLSYQCISFRGESEFEFSRGLRLSKLRSAIQPLADSLEELTIEVDTMMDLWGFNDGRTIYDYVNLESDDEDSWSLYDVGDEDDDDDEDDSDDEDNSEYEEIDGEKELDSLCLNQELEQLVQQYGYVTSLWGAQGIRNIPNVAIEDIQSSLDRLSLPLVTREPSWSYHQPDFLGSLAHFKKLRNVTVPAIVLQDPWPYSRHDLEPSATVYSDGTAMTAGARKHLKTLLPKSIEHLTLFKLEGTGSPCANCLAEINHGIGCHDREDSLCFRAMDLQMLTAPLSIGHLPNLEQDIQEVLETQTLHFPKLIAVEQKEPRSCRVSAGEEQLWKTSIPYA